ncbi:hypothetical protein [Enterococcus faecium]|nr:hypothetical protein [Enterococcus faecium]
MNQEELFQKVKEMIKNGNFDGAKRFIEEHKEQLGPLNNSYFDFKPSETA